MSLELQGRKRQLCLLNIVIDALIEVMALVCLHDHREMIPKPVTLVLSLKKNTKVIKCNPQKSEGDYSYIESEDHCVQVVS